MNKEIDKPLLPGSNCKRPGSVKRAIIDKDYFKRHACLPFDRPKAIHQIVHTVEYGKDH